MLLFLRIPTLLAIFWRKHIRAQWSGMASPKQPVSFIIFRLDSLGDVVLTTPLFRALKTAFPKSRCTAVVQAPYRSLLATNPHIDEILTLPRVGPAWLPRGVQQLLAALSLYRMRLRTRRFDFAISPRWDTDEHLATFLCALTNAKTRVGYTADCSRAKRRLNGGFDSAFDICLPPGPVRHEVERNLAIVGSLGRSIGDGELELPITDHDRGEAARYLGDVPADARLIAIGIGAHSAGRRWPLERFAAAVERLVRETKILPVIICSRDEAGEANRLNSMLRDHAMLVCGARLREVCALLERCDLFIGNDSGCAHLAAAMGRRVIVISRHPKNGDPNHYNSPIRFAPRGRAVRILQPARGLDHCRAACVIPSAHCISAVTVEEVVMAAQQLLGCQDNLNLAPLASRPLPVLPELLEVHAPESLQRAVEALRISERTLP